MASIRALRKRIKSIGNLSQVTRAMEMVAASRMRRAQEQVKASRPYAAKAWELLSQLALQDGVESSNPLLLDPKKTENICLILITGNRGLAGGYNSAVIREITDFINKTSKDKVKLITVGKKGRDFMRRIGYIIEAEFGELPNSPSEKDVSPIARCVIDMFLQGESDAVYIGYTDFVNVLRQEPWVRQLLPVKLNFKANGNISDSVDSRTPVMNQFFRDAPAPIPGGYSYEPSSEVVLDLIVKRFIEMQIYQAVVESLASEHAARMVAMRNATQNANDLVKDLKITYNKLRQQVITEEMLDIVGGAEALATDQANDR